MEHDLNKWLYSTDFDHGVVAILKSVEENTTRYNRHWLRDLILKKKW